MHLKRTILILIRCTGINLALPAVAAMFDLLLSIFSFPAFTIACFAVAGVFSGVFCCNTAIEQIEKEQRKRVIVNLLIWISILCASFFIVVAPLSGQDYNLPVKFFAVTEMATALFVWKNKFYDDVEIPSPVKKLNNKYGQMKVFIFPALAFIIVTSGYPINSNRKIECRIIRMTSDAGDTLDFLYDARGKVQIITETGGHITHFDYKNNIIIATETVHDSISYKRVITLTGDGMMNNLFEESYNAGVPQWSYTSYTYNGNELSATTTVTSKRATPVETTLDWSNGNFISEKGDDNSGGVMFAYYTDKAMLPGDYWYINLLATLGMGDRLYRNKNLLKSIRAENATALISYGFDKDGKIISMTKTNGDKRIVWHYEYECK